MTDLLKHIGSEKFCYSFEWYLSAVELRDVMRIVPEYMLFHLGRRTGEIETEDIKDFIASQIMIAEAADHDKAGISLGFLAVALEDDRDPFAEIYLKSIAELEVDNLRIAKGIALVCLLHRTV